VSELTKHGLGEADLHGSVNFFAKVGIADDARASLRFEKGHSAQVDSVTLRTEQDVLIVLSTAPHPLDVDSDYQPSGVRVEVSVAQPVDASTDANWRFRDEAARALEQSRRALV